MSESALLRISMHFNGDRHEFFWCNRDFVVTDSKLPWENDYVNIFCDYISCDMSYINICTILNVCTKFTPQSNGHPSLTDIYLECSAEPPTYKQSLLYQPSCYDA